MKDTTEVNWYAYLIRNKNNALYCGVTNDVKRRFRVHQEGKGAKALKGKGPLTLEWSCAFGSKSIAMKVECFIKKLSKQKKEQLVCAEAIIHIDDNGRVTYSNLYPSNLKMLDSER
ncbi:GIY-YIG nuclease family protein, partial [Vibrio azureus]